MRQNNSEHYKIVISLKNRFNYLEYVNKCNELKVSPKHILEYAQKVGLLTVAENYYPDIKGVDAYDRLFQKHSLPEPSVTSVINIAKSTNVSPTCGSCGGGKVR